MTVRNEDLLFWKSKIRDIDARPVTVSDRFVWQEQGISVRGASSVVAFESEQKPTVQSANQNEESGKVVAFGSEEKSILQSANQNKTLGDTIFLPRKFVELILCPRACLSVSQLLPFSPCQLVLQR